MGRTNEELGYWLIFLLQTQCWNLLQTSAGCILKTSRKKAEEPLNSTIVSAKSSWIWPLTMSARPVTPVHMPNPTNWNTVRIQKKQRESMKPHLIGQRASSCPSISIGGGVAWSQAQGFDLLCLFQLVYGFVDVCLGEHVIVHPI